MRFPQYIFLLFCLLLISHGFGQVGYQKDSLQIKVYTVIEYRDGLVKEMKVKKVFCDYCTKYQTEQIKEEALRRIYLIRNDVGVKLENGEFNYALYIRISKKDFMEMKKDSITNN